MTPIDGQLFANYDEPAKEEIPWTLDRAIAVFLNRWCHRALGERTDAERELRDLIAQGVKAQSGEAVK